MFVLDQLYPDLVVGGLRAALQPLLTTVVINPPAEFPGLSIRADDRFGAGASAGERSIGVGIGSAERVFIGSFWEAGVCLGAFLATRLRDVADLFERWLTTGDLASGLTGSDTLDVTPRAWAIAHEQGPEAYVGFWWEELLRDPYDARVPEMVKAAARVPVLRGLRPFLSHAVLHFSRCTGFPFSQDCPSIIPESKGLYSVADASGTLVGRGSAVEAALLAAAQLPLGTGPARRGTWED